jgi:hypothetical protein
MPVPAMMRAARMHAVGAPGWEPVFGKDHAQNKNLERDDDSKKNHPALVAETGRRIELYLALMLLCRRRPTKLVALRQAIRRKRHQGGGDAGSGGRHRELRISLGELPVVFRSDHCRPPSEIASCSAAGSRREPQQPNGAYARAFPHDQLAAIGSARPWGGPESF